MTDSLLSDIREELGLIRKLLEAQAAQPKAASALARSSTFSTPSAAQAEIPQPTQIVDDPGSVQVHYGKNNGVALDKLSERSCEWYAQEQAPKLDSSGKAYPPRPQDTILANAARQIYHTRKGTLRATNSGAFGAQQDRESVPRTDKEIQDDENVPF